MMVTVKAGQTIVTSTQQLDCDQETIFADSGGPAQWRSQWPGSAAQSAY